MSLARAELVDAALRHGFSHVRFATVGRTPRADAYLAWIEAGHHGQMQWMETSLPTRVDPRDRMPGARTAMVLAIEHAHRRPSDPGGRTGLVARYAWGRDYHNLVGKRLKRLAASLRDQGVACWGGVDTAPILERSWASAAGLGFSGKNTLQILPARTSWMFLAVLFVDVDVAPDPPMKDHCGRCRRCLDACPTDAFPSPRVLDARKCIAYWTIEARGLPPRRLRPAFGRWVFGCDVCQEVCPHNAAAPDPEEADLAPRHAWLDLDEVIATPDEALMERFLGTPLRRPQAHGLKRNALIALANLADPGGLASVERGLHHPHPEVRAAAVWALHALGDGLPPGFDDSDPLVAEEVAATREQRG